MDEGRRFTSAFDRLTEDEQLACRRDIILYGTCFIFERDDGSVYRVPAIEADAGVEWQIPEESGRRWFNRRDQ
jgi:hypothetical protein